MQPVLNQDLILLQILKKPKATPPRTEIFAVRVSETDDVIDINVFSLTLKVVYPLSKTVAGSIGIEQNKCITLVW